MRINCDHCGTEFNKAPSQMAKSKSGKHYCSSSCAASYNNAAWPKRSPQGKCATCEKPIPSKLKYCKEHRVVSKFQTLADVLNSAKGDANIYNGIRGRARNVAYKVKAKVCERCGYDKHTEVCHVIPIADFSLDASIDNDINHIDNLLVLCPNCHWEHDNQESTPDPI